MFFFFLYQFVATTFTMWHAQGAEGARVILYRPVTTSNSLQNAAAYMYQLATEVYHVMWVDQ